MDFEALVGAVLADKYKILDVVGVGAMGCVYRAEQVELGRSVALKLLISERVTEHVELFRTEALAASRINHPHAISIYDFGVTRDEGVPYLVMEFLHGRVLADVIAEGPLRPARVATIGAQVLSALAEAHACGVIHRDLKADNIILEPLRDGDDYAKLIDFGIARLAETDDRIDGIAGTPAYMAPEQIRGEAVTAAADLYSIGVLLYEMVVGETPFGVSDDVMAVLQRHLAEEPTAPKQIDASCPQALSDLIMKALRKDPTQRWDSARQMRDALVGAVKSAEAKRSCPSCAELVGPVARFCPGCGHKLDEARRRRATLTPPFEAEPREHSAAVRAAPARVTRLTRDFAAPPPSLVGRSVEFLRVSAFIGGEGADGAALSIVGPRGVGKGRLVLEAARAPKQDKPVFFAGADPSGLRSAWFPVVSMIQALFELDGSSGPDELVSALEAYGLPDRDLPGLCELFGMPGPLGPLVDEVRLRELEAATLRVLVFAHRRWPGAVLCFNDLDRYDGVSQQLVSSVCSRLDGTGTRVITTSARREVAPAHSSVMALGPLSTVHAHVLACVAAPDLDVPAADELKEITGGVPESVEQLVRWVASGHSAHRAPRVLVDLIAQRLSILLPAARRVLQSIAIHGTTCPRDLAEVTHGEFDETARAALGELIDEGLVIGGDDTLLLSSELLRDVVRQSTPVDVARALHRNALAGLQGRANVPIAVLARHAAGALDLQLANAHCTAAARDSQRRFDDAGAATWYARAAEVATELIAAGHESENARLIDATIRLADSLRRFGNTELAKEALTQAALGKPSQRQRAAIAQQRGQFALAGGDVSGAVRHFRKAIDLAIKGGERGDLLADTYLQLAEALVARNKPADAIMELNQAIQMASYSEGFSCTREIPQLWRMGVLLAETRLGAGDVAGAEDVALSAFAYASRIDSVPAITRLSAVVATIAARKGDDSRAHEFRMRGIDAARRVGDRRTTAELMLVHAKMSGDDNAAAQAHALAREIGWHDVATPTA